jgi:hypothetical protein
VSVSLVDDDVCVMVAAVKRAQSMQRCYIFEQGSNKNFEDQGGESVKW